MSTLYDDELSVIRVNLDKLHLEKSALDQELDHLFRNRKSFEQNVERARLKRRQAIDCHNKMQDALKMARFKTENIEMETKSLEGKSEKLREKISRLQSDLESELKREDTDLIEFEDRLNHLSYLFLNAVTFYTDERLEEENEKVERESGELEAKLSQVTEQVETLSGEFEGLTSHCASRPWIPELPPELRGTVLKLFRDEHEALQQTLDRVAEERRHLGEELDRLV